MVSEMVWGIGWTFIRAVESLKNKFCLFSCEKSCQKSTEELCIMTLKSDVNFQEKLTVSSKKWDLIKMNFNARSGKSEKLLLWCATLINSI